LFTFVKNKNIIMKNFTLALLLFLLTYSLAAQTSHSINAGDYYYTPNVLTINIGDDVSWVNEGGYHNVNFDVNTITGSSFSNPEAFSSTPTSNVAIYTHVFTIPGTYEYDCSVGSHAVNGKVGTIIVNSAPAYVANFSSTDKSKFRTFNMFGYETFNSNFGPIIYRYADGSV